MVASLKALVDRILHGSDMTLGDTSAIMEHRQDELAQTIRECRINQGLPESPTVDRRAVPRADDPFHT